MPIPDDKRRDVYIVGLRNAHALENEALQIMNRQVERLTSYPDLEARLRQHIEETKGQQARLEQILERHGEDRSALKDTMSGLMGNLAAMGHVFAGDEILKNMFANYAFESYEIAAYNSLVAIAQAVGDSQALSALEQNLGEEIEMQQWLDQHVEPVTLRYLALEQEAEAGKI